MTFHVANFPIISTILASSSQGQSPSLRQKSEKLLLDDVLSGGSPVDIDSSIYRNCVQRRLWSLVQTTLGPAICTRNASARSGPEWAEIHTEVSELIPLEMDDLEEFANDGPITLEDLDNSDIESEDDMDAGWALHQLAGFEIQRDDCDTDAAVGYQQWWREDEDMEPVDGSILEDIKEESDSQPEPSLRNDTYHQPSNPEGPRDIATTQDYSPSDSKDTILDIDNMDIFEYAGEDDTVYSIMDEFVFDREALLWDESRREEAYRGSSDPLEAELRDGNSHPNKDYGDVEMYQQY